MIRAIPGLQMIRAHPISHSKANLHLLPPALVLTNPAHPTSFRSSTRLQVRRSSNHSAVESTSPAIELESGANVVRKFYNALSCRDLATVESVIALNCVYEDLLFNKPYVGRQTILEYFNHLDFFSKEMSFVIDDISEMDDNAVGMTWHVDWNGRVFPFSRGVSFYRLDVFDGNRQITYARDGVEPAMKPGGVALVGIRTFTWLLRTFPSLVNRL